MFSPKIFDLDFTHPAIPGSRMTALRATEDGAPVLTVADRVSGGERRGGPASPHTPLHPDPWGSS